jgi:hypothetical protein
MNYQKTGRYIVGMGLCLGVLIVAVYGFSLPVLMLAIACVAVAIWLPWQLGLEAAQDPLTDYQLSLIARLDDPDQEIHHQAENERELLEWRKEQ